MTKFGTVIELCIFYPKTKELILFIYANEFYDVIFLFSSLKGTKIQATENRHFQTYYSKVCNVDSN